MSIEPLKFLLQPVAYERDDETGRVVREIPAQVFTVFSAEEAAFAVNEFVKAIYSQNGAVPQEENGMPLTQETVLNIVCDNAACPGNDLDPADRLGWTFVSTEVYGQPPTQFVYCSAECAGTVGDALTALEAEVEARDEAVVE